VWYIFTNFTEDLRRQDITRKHDNKLNFKPVIAKCCLAGVKVVRIALLSLVLLTS
jgi:hypothetical protein